MSEVQFNELKSAYEAVFDERGQIQACGRDRCANLIRIIKRYTNEDVGSEKTGMIEVETMKRVYAKITSK